MSSGQGTSDPDSKKQWRARGLRFALWMLIAALFTWAIVDYSMRRGRLVVPAAYDDVTYMSDGLRRLRIAQHEGFAALIGDYFTADTHSPYSSAMAFLGFAVLGVHDWAPYVTNGLIVLGMLLGVDTLCRGRPLWEKMGFGLFALSAPLAGYGVQEFRPDLAGSLLGAACVAFVLNGSWLAASRARLIGAGVLAGLALVAKPTFSPLMLVLFVEAMVLVTWRDRMQAPDAWTWKKAAKACLVAGVVALLVALPYFAVNLGHVLRYFDMVYNDYVAKRKEEGLGFLGAAQFYLTGFGGHEMLGRHVYLWAGLLAAGAAYGVHQRKRVAWISCAAWCAAVLAAYVVVSMNSARQQFLGLPFQMLLMAGLLTFLAWAWQEMERRQVSSFTRIAAMGVLLFTGWKCAQWPSFWYKPQDERVVCWHSAANEMNSVLSRGAVDPGQRILFTITGDINADLMRYMDLKADRTLRVFRKMNYSLEPAHYSNEMDQATWVIASEAGNKALAPLMPSTNFAGQSLALIEARPDFERVAKIPSYEGKCFFVYRRKTALPSTQAAITAP